MQEKKATLEIPIEHFIKQLDDGIRYTGWLGIDGVNFEFDFRLAVPISHLGKKQPDGHLFNLVLKKNGVRLTLSKEKHEFFGHLILTMAEKLYRQPNTRAINAAIRTIVSSIVLKGGGILSLKPEERDMLRHDFGCKLPIVSH